MVRGLAYGALVLAGLSAAAASLIFVPAPNKSFALLAIVVGERSLFLALGGALATVLALAAGLGIGLGAGAGAGHAASPPVAVIVVALLLGGASIGLAMIPALEARELARGLGVSLDLGRYARARIDTEGPVVGAPLTLTYATVGGRPLQLDVYPGRGGAAAGPGRPIVVLHGGGWNAGDKGDASFFSQWLAGQGFTVFDVAYRLAPQPNWASAIADVRCALGWIAQHPRTESWSVDPRQLTLLGRSAGGHLALLAAYSWADLRLPPASCDVPGTPVEAVIALYPVTDLLLGYAHPARQNVYDSTQRLLGFVGGAPTQLGGLYHQLSPVEHVGPGSPRTLLIHGGRDQFVGAEQSRRLFARLRASSARNHALMIIPYAQHSFDFVFGGFSEQLVEVALRRFLDGGRLP